jgi:hypothetical protein
MLVRGQKCLGIPGFTRDGVNVIALPYGISGDCRDYVTVRRTSRCGGNAVQADPPGISGGQRRAAAITGGSVPFEGRCGDWGFSNPCSSYLRRQRVSSRAGCHRRALLRAFSNIS